MGKEIELIGLDRDGVIAGKRGDYKNNSPSQYKGAEMPLIMETIYKLQELKLPVVIFSNQAGIEAGYTTQEIVTSQFLWLIEVLKSYQVRVEYALYCPDKAGSKCVAVYPKDSTVYGLDKIKAKSYRKPDRGMGELLFDYLLEPFPGCDNTYKMKYYVGDLSGKPGYAKGSSEPDSDLKFAKNMNWDYLDVEDFLSLK